MASIKIIMSFVLLIAIVDSKSINQKQHVSITKLNMQQYRSIVEHSQHVWIIQICEPHKATEDFIKAAFVLRGIAKAGIINCLDENQCNEIDNDNNIANGKIVFVHSEGVKNDFILNHDFNLIVNSTMKLIHDKIENQKKNIEQHNTQTVEFSTENF